MATTGDGSSPRGLDMSSGLAEAGKFTASVRKSSLAPQIRFDQAAALFGATLRAHADSGVAHTVCEVRPAFRGCDRRRAEAILAFLDRVIRPGINDRLLRDHRADDVVALAPANAVARTGWSVDNIRPILGHGPRGLPWHSTARINAPMSRRSCQRASGRSNRSLDNLGLDAGGESGQRRCRHQPEGHRLLPGPTAPPGSCQVE
jgi:hypothetical protein